MLRLTINHIHNHFGVSPYSRHVATTVTKRTKKVFEVEFFMDEQMSRFNSLKRHENLAVSSQPSAVGHGATKLIADNC